MAFLFIVTLPGYNAADPNVAVEHCAIHSNYASPKMKPNTSAWSVNSGVTVNSQSATNNNFGWLDISLNANPALGVTTLLTFPHQHTYIPAAIVYAQDKNLTPNTYSLVDSLAVILGGSGEAQLNYETDLTNLYITLNRNFSVHNLSGARYVFKYYICVENGS